MKLPNTLRLSRVSPSVKELEWLEEWLSKNIKPGSNILEYGCGPSTWVIKEATKPKNYVTVEHYVPIIKDVMLAIPDLTLIKTTWYDIPPIGYDFIFVDSSAGYPPGGNGLFRHEAAKYSENLLNPNGYIALHDWHGRSGKKPRAYLENNGYTLVDSITHKVGIGIYRK